MKKTFILAVFLSCWCGGGFAQRYWDLDEGGNSISWEIKNGLEHHDHLEMSGKQVSVVLRYGVDEEGRLCLNKSMVWTMLRTIPNNTHASLMRRFDWDPLDGMTVNGYSLSDRVEKFTLDGTLQVHGRADLGGETFHAAIWANDQAEYINPYFPFVGYDYGNASALNSFKHFARYMNDEWKPIPSSIIAEGDGYWNGAGDRGDAAMIAYGAARYVLARGDQEEARELWPLIQWCLEYCHRKLTPEGVVASVSAICRPRAACTVALSRRECSVSVPRGSVRSRSRPVCPRSGTTCRSGMSVPSAATLTWKCRG